MLRSRVATEFFLYVGPSRPVPLTRDVLRTLVSIEISEDVDQGTAFQLLFRMHQKDRTDFDLLRSQVMQPFYRCQLFVGLGANTQLLLDGVITHQEIVVSAQPGTTDLVVMGRDLSVMLDLEEKRAIFKNQKDSAIAQVVLGGYGDLLPSSTVVETRDSADATYFSRHQLGTDLAFLRELAARNDYIFYLDASRGGTQAYFGPEGRTDAGLPALTVNLGPATNVKSLRASYNAFQPAEAEVEYFDFGKRQPVSLTMTQASRAALGSNPVVARRRLLESSTVIDSNERANVTVQAAVDQAANALSLDGRLDTQDYGALLRPNYLIGVRGLGQSFDGQYYVRRVQHHVERANCTQSFSLSRESTGNAVSRFTP